MSWAIAGAVSQEAAREESPDSGIAAARRAIQGNAPANGRGPLPASQRKLRGRESGYGKCHREYTAGAHAPLRWLKGKPCEPPQSAGQSVRVKRWGKSPPREWQHSRHGKPRVEQGQIGGEGWPGPSAPSGRLLESRSDPGPRGMIAAARKRSTESGLQVHPPTSSLLRRFPARIAQPRVGSHSLATAP